MKASRIHSFGPPDVITFEEIPQPIPAADEALVRVHAAGVGPWDAWVRAGKSVLQQILPLTLGTDLAGTVVATGDPATGVAVGDEVFGVTNGRFVGAYAEHAVAEKHRLARMPHNRTFVESAALPVAAVTAMQSLQRAGVMSGQTVLIHGGAGTVGSYAVQLARRAGARVITTTQTAGDADFARELGADLAIPTDSERFADRVAEIDAVIDTVGGELQRQSFLVLKAGGSLVSIVSKPDEQLAAQHHVRGEFLLVDVNEAALRRVAQLCESGALTTLIGVVLPLSAARDAHEMLDGTRPHPRGKIVLRVAAST